MISKIETGLREVCDYELRVLVGLLKSKPDDFFEMTKTEMEKAIKIIQAKPERKGRPSKTAE